MNILVLESSTSSAKAMIYSSENENIIEEQEAFIYEKGHYTLDADQVFHQTINVGNKLTQKFKGSISLIVLITTWHSVFLCDNNFRPMTNVYNWNSIVSSETYSKLRNDSDFVDKFYENTGCMVSTIYPLFKLIYLKENGYNISDYKIMSQGVYNLYNLTGMYKDSASLASGSGLLNVFNKNYYEYLFDYINISFNNLPQIVSVKSTFPITAEMAKLLGVNTGTPVSMCLPDGASNHIAVAGNEPNIMSFSVGTSGALRLSIDKPYVSKDNHSTWCYLSPDNWLIGAATSGAGNCSSWYKNKFFPDKSYAEIESVCASRDDSPVFLPFLYGERSPGWNDYLMGSFHSIKDEFDNYDFFTAVLEGILFNLYQCYLEIIKTSHSNDISKIVLSGGIVHSEFWTQLCVDIFGRIMDIPVNLQSSLLGGVIFGLTLNGEETEAKKLMKIQRTVKPNKDKFEYYQTKYQKYLKHYNYLIKNH